MLTSTAVAYSYCKYLVGPRLTGYFFCGGKAGEQQSKVYHKKNLNVWQSWLLTWRNSVWGFNVSVCWSVLSPAVKLEVHPWLPARLTTKLKVLLQGCCWLHGLRPWETTFIPPEQQIVCKSNSPRNHCSAGIAFNLLLGGVFSRFWPYSGFYRCFTVCTRTTFLLELFSQTHAIFPKQHCCCGVETHRISCGHYY